MKASEFGSLLKAAWKEWGEDKAARLGAALAYYTIFSIGPVLVLIIAVIGFVLGQEAAQGQIVGRIEGAMGREGAVLVQEMVKGASAPATGIIATVFGLVGLILGIIGIFGQLKDALNTIWDVEPEKKSIIKAITGNLFSLLIVAIAGLLLIASLAVSALIGAIDEWTGGTIPGGPILWQALNFTVTLAVITVMFAMIFKFVPDAKIGWKDVGLGAAFTSFLFILGQIAIALYLSLANVGSAFGAASSLVIILVWIYYSAQIIFFGAEITQLYATRHGSLRGTASGDKQRATLKASPWFR